MITRCFQMASTSNGVPCYVHVSYYHDPMTSHLSTQILPNTYIKTYKLQNNISMSRHSKVKASTVRHTDRHNWKHYNLAHIAGITHPGNPLPYLHFQPCRHTPIQPWWFTTAVNLLLNNSNTVTTCDKYIHTISAIVSCNITRQQQTSTLRSSRRLIS